MTARDDEWYENRERLFYYLIFEYEIFYDKYYITSNWLIVLIVGLPQFSETVYTPSLPDIAHALHTSESMVEYTLTIYLFGFALGTLFWGKISDQFGRKICVISGIIIFILGCLGCYLGNTIEALSISRLGGSVGSVLGQAISRNAFHAAQL
ncbi:MAG: MFS transporter [Candidatus Rickettsia vulgarisii]